ncbi:MAG: hypothetical protein JF617_12780 [Burkholderiales bacterium]|nr:hypothetical protein [Burkholderiales bacterium]
MTLLQDIERRALLAGGLALAAVAGPALAHAKEENTMYGLIGQMKAAPGKRDELVAPRCSCRPSRPPSPRPARSSPGSDTGSRRFRWAEWGWAEKGVGGQRTSGRSAMGGLRTSTAALSSA